MYMNILRISSIKRKEKTKSEIICRYQILLLKKKNKMRRQGQWKKQQHPQA